MNESLIERAASPGINPGDVFMFCVWKERIHILPAAGIPDRFRMTGSILR